MPQQAEIKNYLAITTSYKSQSEGIAGYSAPSARDSFSITPARHAGFNGIEMNTTLISRLASLILAPATFLVLILVAGCALSFTKWKRREP